MADLESLIARLSAENPEFRQLQEDHTRYEQELKDLLTFYKSPLGQKLLGTEPRAIQFSMSYMNQWAQVFAETVNAQFRAEMRKRGKEI